VSKAIYIVTTEPNSGKSIVSLGLMQLLLGKTAKVGYFRPIIDDVSNGKTDNHIDTILSYFSVDMKPDEAYAYTRSQVVQLKNKDKDDEIVGHIIHKYKTIENRFDFVLVEGTDFSGEGAIIEWDINVLIAKNLGIPAIILASGKNKTLKELLGNLYMAYDSFMEKGVEVLLIIANKVQPENLDIVTNGLKEKLPNNVLVGTIPINNILGSPTVKEIAQELDAKILFGKNYIKSSGWL
jgi:phosphate acetyltransferase